MPTLDETERRIRAEDAWSRDVVPAIGCRYATATLETFEIKHAGQAEAVAAVLAYVDGFADHFAAGRGLVLVGPIGTGKDHLAAAALRVIAEKFHHTTRWVSGLELFGEFRDLIRRESRFEADTIAKYTAPDVLVISDPMPPAGTNSEHQVGVLLRIVDRRYRSQKPIIVTINAASKAECDQRMSPQVTDRLRHGAITVSCNWPSYREPSK